MAEQKWNRLFFDEWVEREGLDLLRGYKVDNVFTEPLKPWDRVGGSAVQIQLRGTGELNAAYICEIAPGRELKPQRHLYEELVFVLRGRGSTSVWYDEKKKNSFEWQAGSLFAIPLNARYQHFNGSGIEPARYIAVTTAPIMMNLIRNEDFIFDNDAVFPERYAGDHDYFNGKVTTETFTGWDIPLAISFSNFFADIYSVPLRTSNRSVRGRNYNFELANGVLGAHSSEWPGGTFTKLHRHGPGAHLMFLKGDGYSVMWPDGGDKVKEYWGPGTMIVPPDWWWHQHFVVSREPARALALKLSSKTNKVTRASMMTMRSTRRGGNQMDYEDIPAEIMAEMKRDFAGECAKRGTPVSMEEVYSD
jgi:mannose-6-phosphate isomerase-like protein (cupin superfamily)